MVTDYINRLSFIVVFKYFIYKASDSFATSKTRHLLLEPFWCFNAFLYIYIYIYIYILIRLYLLLVYVTSWKARITLYIHKNEKKRENSWTENTSDFLPSLPDISLSLSIGPAVRVFANGPGDLGSIPGRVIPKTLKIELDTTLLNTQHYKVRFKGKEAIQGME